MVYVIRTRELRHVFKGRILWTLKRENATMRTHRVSAPLLFQPSSERSKKVTEPTNKFTELLGKLRTPEEGMELDSIYDDLTREYTSLYEGSQAATTRRDKEIEKLKEENGALKSSNYDLLMSVGGQEQIQITDTNDEDKAPTIDSLFTRKK